MSEHITCGLVSDSALRCVAPVEKQHKCSRSVAEKKERTNTNENKSDKAPKPTMPAPDESRGRDCRENGKQKMQKIEQRERRPRF